MSRLVAFGCSYTYGHGLKDCWNPKNKRPMPQPSSFAWPSLLAKKLNLDLVNLAVPGSSNKKIWHKIVSFDESLTSKDLVVVGWTHLERNCIIASKDKYINISPWDIDSPLGEAWYRYFNNDYNRNLELNLQMSHVSYLLNSKGIKNYHFFSSRDKVIIEKYNQANLLKLNFQDHKTDSGSDNLHPGTKSHARFTKKLYKEIKETQ